MIAAAAASSEVMSYCKRRRLLMYHFGMCQQLPAPQRASCSDICAASEIKFGAALQTIDFFFFFFLNLSLPPKMREFCRGRVALTPAVKDSSEFLGRYRCDRWEVVKILKRSLNWDWLIPAITDGSGTNSRPLSAAFSDRKKM